MKVGVVVVAGLALGGGSVLFGCRKAESPRVDAGARAARAPAALVSEPPVAPSPAAAGSPSEATQAPSDLRPALAAALGAAKAGTLTNAQLNELSPAEEKRLVPALIANLKSADMKQRKNAAWGLYRIPDPDAVEPLLAALRDPAGAGDEALNARYYVVVALGANRDPRALPALIALLEEKNDPWLSDQARGELIRIVGKDLGAPAAWRAYFEKHRAAALNPEERARRMDEARKLVTQLLSHDQKTRARAAARLVSYDAYAVQAIEEFRTNPDSEDLTTLTALYNFVAVLAPIARKGDLHVANLINEVVEGYNPWMDGLEAQDWEKLTPEQLKAFVLEKREEALSLPRRCPEAQAADYGAVNRFYFTDASDTHALTAKNQRLHWYMGQRCVGGMTYLSCRFTGWVFDLAGQLVATMEIPTTAPENRPFTDRLLLWDDQSELGATFETREGGETLVWYQLLPVVKPLCALEDAGVGENNISANYKKLLRIAGGKCELLKPVPAGLTLTSYTK